MGQKLSLRTSKSYNLLPSQIDLAWFAKLASLTDMYLYYRILEARYYTEKYFYNYLEVWVIFFDKLIFTAKVIVRRKVVSIWDRKETDENECEKGRISSEDIESLQYCWVLFF